MGTSYRPVSTGSPASRQPGTTTRPAWSREPPKPPRTLVRSVKPACARSSQARAERGPLWQPIRSFVERGMVRSTVATKSGFGVGWRVAGSRNTTGTLRAPAGCPASNSPTLRDPALRGIDRLLDDEALVDAVWRALRRRYPQSARRGRPATPAEVVLRLLVLKHLKTWSYEQLEWEVRGSVAYRHFCRLGGGTVPDGKTLVRLGQLLEGDLLRPVLDRVGG